MPAAAVPGARGRVDEPEPGAAMDDGEKVAVAPAGTPLTDSATAELKPPLTPVVTVAVPLLPAATDREAGGTASGKWGPALVVPVTATVVVCVLPPPVPVTVTV